MMDTIGMFDDIRSFRDHETRKVIARIIREPEFDSILKYLYPGKDLKAYITRMKKITTIRDFQDFFALDAMKSVMQKSITDLDYTGIENVLPEQAYLFISNHRDIVLDSAFINFILYKHGRETSELAIGNNLLITPLISDLMRLNKSFVVMRNLAQRELYTQSKILSSYIFDTITNRHSSVWIAQREGRAKDGDDKTQAGVLKMLLINEEMSYFITLHQLHILPVSISYEFDPCAGMKASDLYRLENGMEPNTDPAYQLESILRGIQGFKGHVHVSFSEELTSLEIMSDGSPADQIKKLTTLIDDRIIGNYRIWPSSLIAYDMLNQTNKFASTYLPEEKNRFITELNKQMESADKSLPQDEIRKLALKMYARPVINRYGLG